MQFSDLFEARYINLETFRANGEGVKTPVWQVPHEGRVYVWTQPEAWKVKRIRGNERVRVCICEQAGEPLSEWLEARARVLTGEADIAAQRARLIEKYGAVMPSLKDESIPRVVIEIEAMD
ncbi:MAG TPA: PPOX class F420-dependent oxidoreductase [Anaerolineae bacterium]|nr:PPOX class F420-dependent oxidoreductase [Anaerolineae bacterium]